MEFGFNKSVIALLMSIQQKTSLTLIYSNQPYIFHRARFDLGEALTQDNYDTSNRTGHILSSSLIVLSTGVA